MITSSIKLICYTNRQLFTNYFSRWIEKSE